MDEHVNEKRINNITKSSYDVQQAILKALDEEQKPKGFRYLKTFLAASIVTFVIMGLLHWTWGEIFTHVRLGIALSLWTLLATGFALYFWPQPRLIVRGYWSRFAFAKLLIGMTIITSLQLVICPEFASMTFQSQTPFPIFSRITDFYMSFGGMTVCMFLCGLTFSGAGALLAFSAVRKALSFSRWSAVFAAMGLAILGQLPVIGLQLWDEAARRYLPFWFLGSFIAILLSASLFKVLGQPKTSKA